MTGMSRKEKKLGGLARKINRKVGAKAFRSPQEHNLREATAAMLGGPEPEDLDECLEVARMFCYVETGRCLSKGVFRESVEASACVQEYKSDTGEDMVRVTASLAMEIELELPKEEYVALGAAGLQKFARERLGAFTKKTQLGGVSSGMGEAIERAVRSERRGLMTVTAPCGKPEDIPYTPGEAEPLQPPDGDREMGQTPETDQAPKAKKRAADEQAVPEQDETAGGADEEKEVAEQSLDASMDSK